MLTAMSFGSREAFVSALALSLLHSLWQGAALGAVAFALHARMERSAPQVRYGVYSALLFSIFAVWAGTFGILYPQQVHAVALAAASSPAGAGLPVLAQTAPQAASPTAPSATSFLPTLYPYLVALWALGVCALSLRHVGGFWALHRLCRTLSIPSSPKWEACAARLAARLGLRRKFTLRWSARIDVPFACGLIRPYILLPLSALTGLATEQIEALIAHELAHLAHDDVLFNALQICVETILFYHPVVQWLSARIRDAREQRCDDLAVQIIGDRVVYARALFSLEEARAGIPALALGAKGDPSPMSNTYLVGRIRRILGVASLERDPWSTGAKGALALGAATIGLMTFFPAPAHSRPKSDAPQTSATVVKQIVKIMVDANGDKIELDSADLKSDTPVKVNGKEGRFGDLTPAQQQQLRDAMQHVAALDLKKLTADAMKTGGGSSSVITKTRTKIHLTMDGNQIELNGLDLMPGTLVKVNGNEVVFGKMDAAQQKQLREAVQKIHLISAVSVAKAGTVKAGSDKSVNIVSKSKFVFVLAGARIETASMNLTPNTLVTVDGKEGRFGDLPASQQEQIKKAVQLIPNNLPDGVL